MTRYRLKNFFGLLLSFFVLHIYAQESNPYVINLRSPIVEDIPMSRIFSNVEYTQLQNEEKFKLNKNAYYYLSKEYIIVANTFDGVFAYDRITGKLEKEISKQGSGNDEYLRMPIFIYGYDEKNDVFFFDDYQQWKGVELKSNKDVARITKPRKRREISLPDKEGVGSQSVSSLSSDNAEEGWKQGGIFNPWSLGNGKYAGFVNNSTGGIDVGLVIFDETGKVLKSFPNNRTYLKKSVGSPINPGQFYIYGGETYFKESFYNDTVFLIKDERLIPHIVFDTGHKKLPYESLSYEVDNSNDDKYKISFVQETNLYILFNYWLYHEIDKKKILFSGYYDKKSGETLVCQGKDGLGGFIDDINGLASFNPLYINNEEELIGKLSPLLPEQFDETKLSVLGKSVVSDLKKNDNPVIIIARLKK